MRSIILHTLLLALLLVIPTSLSAQTDGSVATGLSVKVMQNALVSNIGAQRAMQLKPVMELKSIRVLSDDKAGFAVVAQKGTTPIVLAYGDEPFDTENPSPEFLYLMDVYSEGLANGSLRLPAQRAAATTADAPQSDDTEAFTNISPLIQTKWAQGKPYYNHCPLYNGTSERCITGCVATAMAQVLNFYKLPKTMHGTKTYGYYNAAGKHVEHTFDFGATTFDWANMANSYSSYYTNAQAEAVATLMYACGVATGMRYSPSNSGSNTWVGTDAINCIMDGLRAEHLNFDVNRVLRELKAGRPVIYSGANSSNGAHCFVIDGCRSDGYLHCNLGWGGGNDGYYLPTDMCNYPSSQAIDCVWPSDEIPTYTPIDELKGKFAVASASPTTEMPVAGQWYVIWNAGRSGSPVSNGLGQTITNTTLRPDGDATDYCANQLVRLVRRESGGYYIQTGLGDYYNRFSTYQSSGTTSSPTGYFYISQIEAGYFAINSNSACYLDTNGPGSTVVGWSQTKPTDKWSNSSWQFYPVTLVDTDPAAGLGIGTGATFDNDKTYTLKNTGYSQGYLVAMSPDDANPTLRGVTQNHSNGLYSGAAYHDAVDVYNEGLYWRIITEGRQQFLVNYSTGKYLAHTDNQKPYVFTDTKTPINIVRMADGTYRFNTSTEAKSFLCAATHLQNPAAYWTYDDAGSIWQVEEAEVPRPYTAVEGISIDAADALLFKDATLQLSTTVVPDNATDPSVVWTSSNPDVATVSTTGLVTANGAGKAIITATSADVPSVAASITVSVLKSTRHITAGQFDDGDVYLLRNVGSGTNRYSQGYLVALSADDAHPTLRGVEVIHPSQGNKDEHYLDAPDFLSPYSYWQILTDGTTCYLYNVGTRKFLTNEGNETCYIFTDEPTPINIANASSTTFRFNTGTHENSFLCAATQLDNPAAYWKSNDVGTYWSVEAVEGFDAIEVDGPLAVDFFEAMGRRVVHLVHIIDALPRGEATLDDVERTKRYILHQKQQ